MAIKRCFRHAEHIHLGGIGISHKTAIKPGRTTGDGRHRLGQPAASARLGCSEPLTALEKHGTETFGKFFQFGHNGPS